jgi:hypothetical protein
MSVMQTETFGKEQLILLPIDQHEFELAAVSRGTQPVAFHAGRQDIVVSGYAGTLAPPNNRPERRCACGTP